MGAMFGVPAPPPTYETITFCEAGGIRDWVVKIAQPTTSDIVTAAARAQHPELAGNNWRYRVEDGATSEYPGGNCVQVTFGNLAEPSTIPCE
jgi:hypothetical protein